MDEFAVPDGGYGWVIVFASFLMNFVVVGMPRSFGVMYVILTEKFNATATDIAWVHSLYNTVRMVLGPVTSMMCDRFTARKVVLVGSVLLFTGVTTSAFVTSIYPLYFTYGILAGLGGSMMFTPSLIVVGDYFNKKKGTAMAISTIGAGFGTMAFSNMFTFLLSYYGYFGGMLVIGSVTFHCAIAGALLRPLKVPKFVETRNVELGELKTTSQSAEASNGSAFKNDNVDTNEKSDISSANPRISAKLDSDNSNDLSANAETLLEKDTNNHDKISDTGNHQTKRRVKLPRQFLLFKNFPFLIYGMVILVMPICLQVVFLFVAGHAKKCGVPENKRAIILSIMGFADVVGRISFGFIFDLKPIRQRRRSLHSVLGILFGLASIGIGLSHSYLSLIFVCSLHGIFEGAFHAQRASVLSEMVPRDLLSISVGYMTFFQGIGNFLWPIVGGQLRDNLNSFEEVFYLAGSLLALASLIYLVDYIIYEIKHKKASHLQCSSPQKENI